MVTSDDPNPIPAVGSINNISQFVFTHPGFGCRNVALADPGSVPSAQVVVNLTTQAQPLGLYVTLAQDKCPKGLRRGVRLWSPGSAAFIKLPQSPIPTPNQLYSLASEVLADFNGDITLSF